jgi:Cdc6-like AAA superfamily ATPase
MKLPSYQDLSKEQDRINNLPLEGSYLVTGPPGTGKTVMALYRAQMLSKRNAKAQLLMYSRLLSQYT